MLKSARSQSEGFTLIEIMIVVGIMGIILTMGVPLVYKIGHKAPLTKAITDVIEVCSNARARAILQGHEVDVTFYPRERRFAIGSPAVVTPAPVPNSPVAPPPAFVQTPAGTGTASQLPDEVRIEELDINKIPGGFKDADQARVRFFPNGTSDELSLFLECRGQRCEILLEVTTGLANVEWDVRRFR